MSIIDFDFNQLGNWPEDCIDQQDFISQLQTKLNELKDYALQNTADVVVLSQAIEPTQSQWEYAYVTQTGKSLPIPATAVLLWYNTSTSEIAGEFGTITGFPTVEARFYRYNTGLVLVDDFSYDNTARSSTRSLFDNQSVLPTEITFSIPVPCLVILMFSATITANGSGAGVDFMLNETKIGTEYYAVQPNGGIHENLASARFHIAVPVDNLPAGTYTARALLGNVGAPASPAALGWGGANNVTIFGVQAVAK